VNFKTWFIAGSLAEEDTETPFDGATLVVEKIAYDLAVRALKEIALDGRGAERALAQTTLEDLGELKRDRG
jgi:hypothetical protein